MANEAPVVGTEDNVAPEYDLGRRMTIWGIVDIFFGTIGLKKYVPNEGDLVVDVDAYQWFRVSEVDPTTLIPTLKAWSNVPQLTPDSVDVLLGPTPGVARESARAYINKKVIPYSLQVEGRTYVNVVNASFARITRRNPLTGQEEMVGQMFDQSGTFTTNDIPLDLVSMENGQNFARKSVRPCYTMKDIEDGETLTVKFYNDQGDVVSINGVLAYNTAALMASNAPVKYITGISVESPFLSDSDPNLLEFPMNTPLIGLNIMGVVHYSDGSKIKLPVDQTKFSIWGLEEEGYVTTQFGQKFPVTLSYVMSQGESSVVVAEQNSRTVTRGMEAITTNMDGSYVVKLFPYPVWVDSLTGYRLKWFLYSLDRDIAYDVTGLVRLADGFPGFDPKAYMTRQTIRAVVNLHEVNGSYKEYRHVQSVDITLMGPGSDRTTNWTIGFDPGQTPPYGRNNYAAYTFINQNLSKVKIDMGETDKAVWLDRIFYQTKPVYDRWKEVKAPEPTFFALRIGATEIEFPISQWNSELQLDLALTDNDTLFIKFYTKTNNNIIQLGVAGIPIYQQ